MASARAADLWDVYQLVRQNTPLLRQAEADYKAVVQNKPIARSDLLPQLSINATRQRDKYSGSQLTIIDEAQGTVGQQQFSETAFTTFAQLQLTQTLFDWQDWVALAKADVQAAQAAASLDVAQQDVIIQTAQAYFNVLEARDILHVTQADEEALARQLHQAQRRYEVGLSGIVAVQQARAAHDQSRAQVIQQRQVLTSARQVLQTLTTVPITGGLKGPGEKLPLNKPEPNNLDKWVDVALRQNAKLVASRLNAKVAAKEVDRQQAVRYPDVSLFAGHVINNVKSNNAFSNQNLADNVVGIQVSLPIFSGGAIAARSRQAKYQHVSAEAARDQQALEVRGNTVNDFRDVLSGIASVKALRESVKSSAASLDATEKAFKVSSATILDVLRAREVLLNAQTAYAQARYAYLLSMLQLKQDAGSLGPKDVKAMSEYFTEIPIPFAGEDGKGGAPKANPLRASLREQRGG